ncbi:uncharacterized protein LOC128891012 isoform X2 [Hylaeus anthracinus]|nr:uncharacterized protein LOC128891012 isoform X2 [Hylaeus anthracinus]
MSYDFFDAKIHTTKCAICFISNDNQYLDIVGMIFSYIFTACYAVRFHFNEHEYVESKKFLKTDYERTEVTLPELRCSYNVVHNATKNKKLHFEMNFSTSIVSKVLLQFGLFYIVNGEEVCDNIIHEWDFDVLKEYAENKYYNSNTSLLRSRNYEKNINFSIEVSKSSNYCFLIALIDERCTNNTLWNPPMGKSKPCQWIKECYYTPKYDIGPTEIGADSYLYWPIGIITLIMFGILGIVYLMYTIHIHCIQGKRFYINCGKSNVTKMECNQLNICTSKDKGKTCESISTMNRDIVLLYPKSSESFMALMGDFREMLSRVCQCPVHDWHNGTEWNYVAEIGASDWFAEMLNKGYRVIWIDTPMTRSLISRRFKCNSYTKNSEQFNFTEVGDFRDMVFPTIFNIAKRNIENSILEQHKHFIVRLKGFENFENENDPFIDLSVHIRYLIPQDLNTLCSDLIMSDSNLIVPLISQEENLIKQHLYDIEFDFYK